MIVKICKRCGGSGNRVVSVKPLTFKNCNNCGGNGGRSMPTTQQKKEE